MTGNDVYFDWPVNRGKKAREVWYSLVTHPTEPLAVWYRYSLISSRDRQEGRVWIGVSDERESERCFLRTESFGIDELRYESPLNLETPVGGIENDGAYGETDGVSWRFSYSQDTVTFTPLRSEKLTSVAEKFLGSGRHWSFNQSVEMDGVLEIDGREFEFRDAPGHQGHTVGRSMPEKWSWMHCNSFKDSSISIEALYLDGKTTVCFRRGGDVYMLNRLNQVFRRNRTRYSKPGRWRLMAGGRDIELDVRVNVDPGDCGYRKACYLAPGGGSRYVAHCSLADIEVNIDTEGYPEKVVSDKARVEWGSTSPPVGKKEEYTPPEYVD